LRTILTQEGYSPVDTAKNELALRNCPFDSLAAESVEPVCAMNLALIEGLVEWTGADCRARLTPTLGWCCVRLRHRSG
jgi:predicted ArsR family transcriptional regulator